MASLLGMAARRTVFYRISSISRSTSLIPRRGLAGAVAPPSPSKWKKGQSLIVPFAGCGLLSFAGYMSFTERTNESTKDNAQDTSSNVGILPKEVDDNSRLMDQFESWIKEKGKVYRSTEEKMRRFEVFKANAKYAEERTKSLTNKPFGLKHFSSLDREEFEQGYLMDLFEWWIRNVRGSAYKGKKEKQYRFERFKESSRFIEEYNKKWSSVPDGCRLGLNQFSDLTTEEFKQDYCCAYVDPWIIELRNAFPDEDLQITVTDEDIRIARKKKVKSTRILCV